MAETFRMDDGRSYRHLSKNRAGEENSALSYRLFMIAQLEKNGGVMTSEQLEDALERNYGASFGPDDKKLIRCGKGKRLKWKNQLDWAKAVAASKGEVATRSRQVNKQRVTYIVLLDDSITPAEWIEWATAKKKKRSYVKQCPVCSEEAAESVWVPLSAKKCANCGHKFPKPNRRVDRIPTTG